MPHEKSHSLGDTGNHTSATTAELSALISDGSLATSASMPAQYAYVAVNGSDTTGDGSFAAPYASIKYALSQITDATAIKPYVIKVGAGLFTEDNPVQLKQYIGIEGETMVSTMVTALNSTSYLFQTDATGYGAHMVNEMVIIGPSANYAVQIGNSVFGLDNIFWLNTYKGVLQNGVSSDSTFRRFSCHADVGTPTDTLIEVTGGTAVLMSAQNTITAYITDYAKCSGSGTRFSIATYVASSPNITRHFTASSSAGITIANANIKGDTGTTVHAVSCDGADMTMTGSHLCTCQTGVICTNGGAASVDSTYMHDCLVGILIPDSGSGSSINMNAISIIDSTTLDLNVLSTTAICKGGVNTFSEEKINIVGGANAAFSYFNTIDGDEGINIWGELHVGSPEVPKETTLGEGDSYIRGLLAYTYNGTIYTDISDDVKTFSGSTFTFPNNSVNTAIYLASDLVVASTSDYHKYFGIKMSITTPQSGGTIIGEYWNGTAWSEFNHMTSQSGGQYLRKADLLFTNAIGSYQVRFTPTMDADWAKNDDPSVDANDRYWIRFRITSSPATLPVFEQFKLHANRSEINADGYLEYMGKARPYVSIGVNWNNFRDAGTALSNQDLWLSSNCKAGFANNLFNSDGDSVGVVTAIPTWVDTSGKLKIRTSVVCAATGNLTMTVYLNSSSDGDAISTTDPSSTTGEQSDAVTEAVTAGQEKWFDFEFDISDLGEQAISGSPPNSVWVNLVSTTRPGNVYGIQFYLSMLKWRDGGHI